MVATSRKEEVAWPVRRGQLVVQPRAREGPVAADGGGGGVQRGGGLVEAEPAEEAALDDLRLPRVEPFEALERLAERNQIVEGLSAAAALLSSRASTVTPAPRLAAPQRTAWSIRTLRIAREAMAKKWARLCQSTRSTGSSFR